jgi:Endomembrane protein 70
VDKAETLLFSYDVFWEKSDVEWSSRWDAYLLANAPNDKVKGLSVVVLGAIVVIVIIIIVVYITFFESLIVPFLNLQKTFS